MVNIRNIVSVGIRNTECLFYSFTGLSDDKEHIALVFKQNLQTGVPHVRVHSECLTGDLFGSKHCDCGEQLNEAIELFSERGGILLYLRQEGRGIGLYNKLDAYALQKQGLDTFEANRQLNLPTDPRNYRVAAEMLQAMGVSKITLLTNNPDKEIQLNAYGIEVTERISTKLYCKPENKNYLLSKILHTKHQFNLQECTL